MHSAKLPGTRSLWAEVLEKKCYENEKESVEKQTFPFLFFDFQCFIFSFTLHLLDSAVRNGKESLTSTISLVLTSIMYDFSRFCPFLKMLFIMTRDKVLMS